METLYRREVSSRALALVEAMRDVLKNEEAWAIAQRFLDDERSEAVNDCIEIIHDDFEDLAKTTLIARKEEAEPLSQTLAEEPQMPQAWIDFEDEDACSNPPCMTGADNMDLILCDKHMKSMSSDKENPLSELDVPANLWDWTANKPL